MKEKYDNIKTLGGKGVATYIHAGESESEQQISTCLARCVHCKHDYFYVLSLFRKLMRLR